MTLTDLRLYALCTSCGSRASGTFIPEWLESHIAAYPDHFVVATRSGIFDTRKPRRDDIQRVLAAIYTGQPGNSEDWKP